MSKDKSVTRLSMVDGKPVGRRYAKIRDASDYLSVNPLTIRNLINSGRIHGYRSSARLIRVDLNEIDALMDRENCGGVA